MRIHPDPDGVHRRRRAERRPRPRRRRRVLLWLALVIALAPALAPRLGTPPYSAFMGWAWLEARRESRAFRLEHAPVPLAAISAQLALAVIAAEDQRFPTHRGFDFTEVAAALREGQATRGASTLSQQLVKNLYLWPGRSWLRKGIEAWYTFWLERFCSKRRILELYLNVAEFGPGIYGAEAASRRYFGKPARALNASEAAMLAAVLPSPRARTPRNPDAALRARQAWILRQMQQLGGVAYLARLR